MSSPVLLRKGNCRKSNQVKEIFNYMRDNHHNYYPNEKTHTMKIRLERDMHTDEFEAEPQKSQPFNCKSLNNKGVC